MFWEKKVLENAQRWADSGEFDKIVRGAYMITIGQQIINDYHKQFKHFQEIDFQNLAEMIDNKIKPIMQLVAKQAEDGGLWGQVEYASEAYIQSQLRELHKVIEEQFGDCREYEEK